jgi:hypothetical protein
MNLSPLPIQKFFGNNGRPLVGGLLFTYEAGTSDKVATYTDASGGSQNTNPIVLDFRGECRIWLDPQQSYKFILSPPGDTDPPTRPIWTVDDITVAPQAFDNAADDIGSVNNISLNIPQISSPVAFTRVVFKAAQTNTGPTTLQINGGTANDVVSQSGSEMSGGEITQNGIYEAIFDGGNWVLQWQLKFPLTEAERAAGVTVVDYAVPSHVVCGAFIPNRYKVNVSPGSTDMTIGIQTAMNLAAAEASSGGSSDPVLALKTVQFLDQDYLCNTVVIEGSMIITGCGWSSRIIPHPSIPDGGSVFLSLSGVASGDETTNLALLTAIYGAGNEPGLRREYDLSGMQIRNLFFHAETTRNISAIWLTGFTQGANLSNVRTRGFVYGTGLAGGAIRLNGSWNWSMYDCSLYGDSTLDPAEGVGLCLAANSNGSHIGATSCNAFVLTGNRALQFNFGFGWRRGSAASITGNDWELCGHGAFITAGKNFLYSGNYHESNEVSLSLGGTGTGTDQEISNATVVSNLFNEDSEDNRVTISNVQNSRIANNEMDGDCETEYLFFTGSENNNGNYIEIDDEDAVTTGGTGALRDGYNSYRYRSAPPGARALVRRSSNQSIADGTATTVSWTTEVTDIGDWFDSTSDATIFTVRAGVKLVRVTIYILWGDNSTGSRRVQLWKNGSTNFAGRVEDRRTASSSSDCTLTSAIIPVATGDTFAVRVTQTSGGPLDVTGGNASYFAIEAVQ